MVIKQITIRNSGHIKHFKYDFENKINIVRSRYTKEIANAILFVLGHRVSPLPSYCGRGEPEIKAQVRIDEREYRIEIKNRVDTTATYLCAYAENGDEVTSEYLYLTAHCVEQDLCEVFDPDEKKMLFKPMQYLDEDCYYALKELSVRTDGLSEIKAFRSYLKAFVKDFKPESLCHGKRYELCLEKNGKYAVRYIGDDGAQVFLSESEQMLFRYLCFLRTAEFWQGFEELRNLHSVKKPILIGDFFEGLDESIDIQDILERTRSLNRQTIILTI